MPPIGLDHLHSTKSRLDRTSEVANEVVFAPSAIAENPVVSGGNVVIGVRENLPEPMVGFENASDDWIRSDEVFFTDGREIYIGWLKYPSMRMVMEGRGKFWNSVDGRIFTTNEVKGWLRKDLLRITIDRRGAW